MKKSIAIIAVLLIIACISGCKEKRCKCTTVRANFTPTVGLEPLGSHSNCAELNAEWTAADSSGDILNKTCVPEE